jgi:hypothetical protein
MHFHDFISESHESGNFYFCFRWILIHFKREFSFADAQRLWEVIYFIHFLRCYSPSHIGSVNNEYEIYLFTSAFYLHVYQH